MVRENECVNVDGAGYAREQQCQCYKFVWIIQIEHFSHDDGDKTLTEKWMIRERLVDINLGEYTYRRITKHHTANEGKHE
jgi:hypothetical protein